MRRPRVSALRMAGSSSTMRIGVSFTGAIIASERPDSVATISRGVHVPSGFWVLGSGFWVLGSARSLAERPAPSSASVARRLLALREARGRRRALRAGVWRVLAAHRLAADVAVPLQRHL